MFFRFPKTNTNTNTKLNTLGNNAANTQTLIELLLDDVSTSNSCAVRSYLQGDDGYTIFRQLSTKILLNHNVVVAIVSSQIVQINLSSKSDPDDGVVTDIGALHEVWELSVFPCYSVFSHRH